MKSGKFLVSLSLLVVFCLLLSSFTLVVNAEEDKSGNPWFGLIPFLLTGGFQDRGLDPRIDRIELIPHPDGDTLLIYGSNFSSNRNHNTVILTGSGGKAKVPADVFSASENKLTVKLPEEASPGPLFVDVQGNWSNKVQLDSSTTNTAADQATENTSPLSPDTEGIPWFGAIPWLLTGGFKDDEAWMTGEEAEEIIDVQDTASEKYQELSKTGDPEAIQETKSWLKSQSNVQHAKLSNEEYIYVQYESGLIGVVSHEALSPTINDSPESTEAFLGENYKSLEEKVAILNTNLTSPEHEKAIFLALDKIREPGQDIKQLLNDAGYLSEVKVGEDFTIEKMKELGEYGLIWIHTHGGSVDLAEWTNGVLSETTWIVTGQKASPALLSDPLSDMGIYPSTFKNGIGVWTEGEESYLMVNQRFINNLDFNDSIVFNNTCSSLKFEKMANTFLNAGAATYLGWTDTSYKYIVDEVTKAMLKKLKLTDTTISEAYQAKSIKYDEWERSYSIEELYPVKTYKDTNNDGDRRAEYNNGVEIFDSNDEEIDHTVDFQYRGNGDAVLNLSNTQPEVSLVVRNQEGPPPLTVEFDASGSRDVDGEIEGYDWDFGDGSTGSGETVNHTFDSAGDYTVELTVTDNDGATNQTSIEINVNAKPELTLTSLSSSKATVQVKENISVTFTVENKGGSVEDSFKNRVFLSTSPYGGSGQQLPIEEFPMTLDGKDSKTEQVDVTIPQVPEGDWYLAVYTDCNEEINESDEGNNIDSIEIKIEDDGNKAPTAAFDASETSGEAPLDVSFDASESNDPDGSIDSYSWDFGDGSTGSGETASHTFDSAGDYTVELTVTDNDRGTDLVTKTISVSSSTNEPPTATINSPNDGATFSEGETITFEGEASDPEDGSLTGDSLVWTSDIDGRIGTGESFSGSDLSKGTHTITLTATDSGGKKGTAQIGITIEGEEVPVNFPDENLEQVIREAINKPSGPIYPDDLEGLTRLIAVDMGIEDLTGLEYCESLQVLVLGTFEGSNNISDFTPLSNLTNLQHLGLSALNISDLSPLSGLTNLEFLKLIDNNISDLSPLSGLTKLEMLKLQNNTISDLSPLSRLTNLRYLDLNINNISDLSPLSNLIHLETLKLWYNEITDISPLSSLDNLTSLSLAHNSISDLSPLSDLINLVHLQLEENNISDITPLVKNSGLGPGDGILLRKNYLDLSQGSEDMQNIQTLIDRGVNVDYEPQKDQTYELTWQPLSPMPTPRSWAPAVSYNGKIYVVGGVSCTSGCDQFSNEVRTLEVYNPSTDSWTQLPSMSTPRAGPAVAALNGKIYVMGGYSNGPGTNSMEIYHIDTQTWTNGPSMPTGRSWGKAVTLNGKIYVLGGAGSWDYYSRVEVFDPSTGSWSSLASFDSDRYMHAAATANGKIYIIGGNKPGVSGYSDIQEYNPSTNTWSTKTPMSTSAQPEAIGVNNKIWVLGADGLCRLYDTETDQWTELSSDHNPTKHFSVAYLNGNLYRFGGGGWGPTIDTVEVTNIE